MAFNGDFLTFYAEEAVSTEESVSSSNERAIFNHDKIYDADKKYVHIYSEIPFEHFMILCILVVFLSFSLNTLVLLHYRKANGVTRTYILALVALDWSMILLCLIPYMFLKFVSLSVEIMTVLSLISTIAINSGFGIYLFPSLFLALDRVLVIMFPLTFRKYVGRMRMLKAVLVVIKLTVRVVDSVHEYFFGVFSFSNFVLKSINLCIFIAVLITIIILYTTMALQIIRSSRKLANSRQTGANGR